MHHGIHHIGRGLADPHRAESQPCEILQTQHLRAETPADKGLRDLGRLTSWEAGLADDARQRYEDDQRPEQQQHSHVERQTRGYEPGQQQEDASGESENGDCGRYHFPFQVPALPARRMAPETAQMTACSPHDKNGQHDDTARLLMQQSRRHAA